MYLKKIQKYEAFLAAIPDLKIENNRLHIRRQPSLFSWLLLFLSVVFFIDIYRRLTDSLFFAIVSLTGQTMLGLDALARWEDLTLDKDLNAVIASQSTWRDKLIGGDPINNTIMKLSDVRHVGVTVNLGLFFVCDDGETFGLDTRGLTRDEIQYYRKIIDCFINSDKNVHFLEKRSSTEPENKRPESLESEPQKLPSRTEE